jgi:hypothetical protein
MNKNLEILRQAYENDGRCEPRPECKKNNKRDPKDVMSAKGKTRISSTLQRGTGKQKVFPKPEIKRVRIVGGQPTAVPPQTPQDVAEPEKAVSTPKNSKPLTEAVPYQPRSRLEWDVNEAQPARDWGLNE